ncbi:MAG: ATP synthase F1 subunit gamma [Candidatus Portnoybacteria bacterium]|nr:ATP synthase F1 subunit gamma [Candidatus Portnoybacteria bacterium]
MPSLRDVKRRITSIRNTSKVTHALEAVSATKMRRWQERALTARPYATKALEFLALLKSKVSRKHAIFRESLKPDAPIAMVVITADKGLCGGHNARLMTKVIDQRPTTNDQRQVYVSLGRYGRDYLKRRGYEIILEEIGFCDKVTREQIKDMYEFLEGGFLKGIFSKILIAYTEFHTTLKQEPKIRHLLPVNEEDLHAIVESITPRYGRYAELNPKPFPLNPHFEYVFEPSVQEILPSLAKELTQVALYHMVLESNASEHSARMVAMKNATDNANDILKDLTLQYNKARQAEITKGVLEVAAGAEALSS